MYFILEFKKKIFFYFHLGQTARMNLFQSVTNALDIALGTDSSAGISIEIKSIISYSQSYDDPF